MDFVRANTKKMRSKSRNRSNKGTKQLTKKIDLALTKANTLANRTAHIIFLGRPSSGKTSFLKSIVSSKGVTSASCEGKVSFEKAQYEILKSFLKEVCKVIQSLESDDFPEATNEAITYLKTYIHSPKATDLPVEVADAIKVLWNDDRFQQHHVAHFERYSYFAKKIVAEYPSFGGKDWVLSPADFVMIRDAYMGVECTDIEYKGAKVKLVDVGGQKVTEQRKWLPLFESYNMVCYMIDVSVFDQMDEDFPNENKVLTAVQQYKDIVKSRILREANFMVILTKVDLLLEKLNQGISLNVTGEFPEAPQSTDREVILEWIEDNIGGICSEGLDEYLTDGKSIYVTLANANDSEENAKMINDFIVNTTFKELPIQE